MATDPSYLSEVRARAAALRQQADEIDAAADNLERIMARLIVPKGLFQPAQRPTRAPRTTEVRASGSKGKAPGTMNMAWRENFVRIAEVSSRDEFPLDLVRDVVRKRTGKDMKLSGIRRHFNSYIEHEYVTSDSPDTYRLTDKLLKLIGYQDSGPTDRNENEAPVADAADASETTLAAQDGGPQE